MTIKNLSLKLLYPDEYLVEEDQMGNSAAQELFLDYFKSVLRYLYRYEGWMVAGERNHYHSALDNSEKMIVPDIAVFKGIDIPVAEQPTIASWDMRKDDKPCPPLVIEASSAATYQNDIEADRKPRLYGLIGVKEYFAYDPNPNKVWPKRIGTRLLGWRYDEQKQPSSIQPNEKGRLWSEVLGSWLEPDGLYLRLYDLAGQMRLTAKEAEEQRANAEEQRATIEFEARQKAEQKIAELERQLAELRRKTN
jgi:Uma2 family endonuclease